MASTATTTTAWGASDHQHPNQDDRHHRRPVGRGRREPPSSRRRFLSLVWVGSFRSQAVVEAHLRPYRWRSRRDHHEGRSGQRPGTSRAAWCGGLPGLPGPSWPSLRRLAARLLPRDQARRLEAWSGHAATVSRPVSGILWSPPGRPVAIHLCGLPGGCPHLSVRTDGPSMPPVRPCSGWGLPSRPGHPGRWCALTAPFHPCL